MKLIPLKNKYAVWQPSTLEGLDLSHFQDRPQELFGLNITSDEISIVCHEGDLPEYAVGEIEKGWKGFKVQGPLDFGLTGILASIANPLAEHKISIFAISTYDTDYVLVKEEKFTKSIEILSQTFHIEDNK